MASGDKVLVALLVIEFVLFVSLLEYGAWTGGAAGVGKVIAITDSDRCLPRCPN